MDIIDTVHNKQFDRFNIEIATNYLKNQYFDNRIALNIENKLYLCK